MKATKTPGCGGWVSALLLGLWLLTTSSCSDPQGPLIIVQVTPILAGADTLQLITILGDGMPKAAQEFPEFPIDNSAGKQYFSLGLRLPAGAAGKVVVAVAAVNKQTSCMLATGVADTVTSVIVDDSHATQLNVTLTALAAADCGQGLRRPRVLGISGSATAGSAIPGEKLTVAGWGFLPGLSVSLAGHPAVMTTWVSPLAVTFQVPNLGGTLGPVALLVVNADAMQSQDQRSDLISYVQQPAFAAPTSYTCDEGTPGTAGDSSVFTAQLDNLHGADVIYALDNTDAETYRVCTYLDNSDGTLGAATPYNTTGAAGQLLVGDFDGKNGLDIAFAGDEYTPTVNILFNSGTGTFLPLNAGSPYDPKFTDYTVYQTAAADLNNDTLTDIVLLIEDFNGANYIFTLMNSKTTPGKFTLAKAITLPTHGDYSFVVAELSGDKFPDLAVSYADGSLFPTVDLFVNQNGTAFASPSHIPSYAGAAEDLGLGVLDLNGDGRLDLAQAKGYLANQMAGGFQKGKAYDFGQPLKLVNLNGDAALDAIFATGYGVNKTPSGIDWLPPVLPAGLEQDTDFTYTEFADLNGDGLTDIIAPGFANVTSFQVFLNTTK